MEIFIGWFVFSLIVAVAASYRGRSGFGWFIIATFTTPILALLLLLVLPNRAAAEAGGLVNLETHHRCPECKELIRRDASKCRYCGSALAPLELDYTHRAKTNIRQARIIFGVFALITFLIALVQHIAKQPPSAATPTAIAAPSPAKRAP